MEEAARVLQRVKIKTPPTFWVTNGPDLSFDLPLVPKPNYAAALALLLLSGAFGLFVIWGVLGTPVSKLSNGIASGTWTAGTLAFTLIFAGLIIAIMSPAIEATLGLAMLFFRWPVLEIRTDGLIDRRVLKRLVRWDEFGSVGERRHVIGQSAYFPTECSFRLKDRRLRRFSPLSATQSFFFGGKRVAINTYGFDVPPRVVLDVILTMIRNGQNGTHAS